METLIVHNATRSLWRNIQIPIMSKDCSYCTANPAENQHRWLQCYCSLEPFSAHCFGLLVEVWRFLQTSLPRPLYSHVQQHYLTVHCLPSVNWWKVKVNKLLVKTVEHLPNQQDPDIFSQGVGGPNRNYKVSGYWPCECRNTYTYSHIQLDAQLNVWVTLGMCLLMW